MLTPVARALALFLGSFTLLNLAGDWRLGAGDANVWWIDFWPLPHPIARGVLVILAMTLLVYALRPRRRKFSIPVLAIAIAATVGNTIRYYVLLARDELRSAFPIPLSLVITALLVVIVVAHYREPRRNHVLFAITLAAAAILFPLAQISMFGVTDYRRPADVIVVFGARAYANGAPSLALADRVRKGVELYRAGLTPRLLFSGGPGDGAFHEPEVMRRFASRLGVPDAAVIEDPHGVNTEATVRNTIALLPKRPQRILAVSHFYHLPRIKMTYQRYGIEVFTVPSETTAPGMVWNLMRETAAFWAYYLRRLRA